MEKLQKIVDDKKAKSANTRPKYGMRKLKVGLVPVFFGTMILFPGVGYAKEVSVATSAPRTEIAGEVLSQKDDKKDEEYAIQKVEAVSNKQNLETTSTSRTYSENVEEDNTAAEVRVLPDEKTEEAVLEATQATAEEVQVTEAKAEEPAETLTEEKPAEKVTEAKAEENIQLGEEKVNDPQQAGETATSEPNYSEEEKNIKDYSGSERYKETDLKPGDTNQSLDITDEKVEKDGFKFDTSNPSPASPDKKAYGYEIVIDKKTGQRTYTKIFVTDGGLIKVDPGNKPMMGKGDKITLESPDVTYKPEENTRIKASRAQRNLNYEASEETLKHINSKDNDSTSFGFKDNYTQDNPRPQFFGGNFGITYKVNPWPNENDKLELMKISGEYNEIVFVQGQDINTGVKVDNIDANAKDRLVGQVYNPITGAVVPGARAYIGDDGNIHIQMPEGALKKNADGNYVVNEESIFNTKDYKGIQNLDVKFFARPRTADEFKTIAETPDENGETGTYVETGAGTGTINHKGTDVTIDKQGIDRYDHYNLIGKLKINLDDTRYYDQRFQDGNGDDTSKVTSSAVKPGEPFEVKMYKPEDPTKTDKTAKTADEMNAAEKRGEAAGEVILDFINKANEGKEDKDQWKVTLVKGDIGKFTVTPPKSAKAGDFVAIPIEYTYTNGSKDTHWFHFVVQESDNYKPEYHAEIGYKGDTLTNTPDPLPAKEDTKKNLPVSYELVPGTYKDSSGNVWDNITIDPATGVVTAVVPEHADIKGGENLYVDVKVNYVDEDGTKSEETIKAQFIARPRYQTEVTKEYESKIPYKTNVVYDDTLEAGKVVETPGTEGKQKLTFKQVVINGEKGIIDENGVFQKDKEAVTTETIKPAVDGEVRIGTKPAETTIEIPRGLEYELDYTRKDGEPEVVEEGNDGVVTVTTTKDPNTGEIKVTKTVTTEAKNKKIKIPAMTEGTVVDTDEIPFYYTVEFDPDFYKNYPDATDNYKVITEGVVGTNKKTWTIKNSQIVGDYKLEKTEPVNAVIKVGQKDYTGTVKNTVTKEVPYTVRVEYNPKLDAGKTNVKQEGRAGSKTYEYSSEIVNGKLKDGTNFTETELTDKYVAPTEHIIEIGTKPVENEKSVEKKVGVDVEWIFDENKGLGTIEVSDLTPGKVTTTTKNKYNPETGKIETTQETVVENGKRTVIIGMRNYDGEFEEVKNNIIPYETEIVFDNTLEAGEKVIVQAGENGETVTRTKRHIENGKVVSSEEPVVEKTKEVKKQIIKVGTMTDGTHSYKEELPFETKVEVNPDLKKGEWRYKTVDGVEQKGKLGSRTTEWTIKNSKVQDEKKVTEERPVDAIIEVGSADFTGEVKHTEHFEIPFEVEVRYNNELPAGTSKEIQKGEKGSYDVEYRQEFKNGDLVGAMSTTESNRTEAKKHIIEVGTKVETPDNKYSKDVEVEIEYVYDNTKDKGVVETGELTKGKVETKVVDKYNLETGKIEQTTEEVVTKAKQKVIVGTKDFTGTYEYKKTCPIPFEVEIIEDDTLSKGEKVVDQKGVAGSKTTSYQQAIKNGNPDGEAKKTGEETTKEPVKHIVRVGTKSLTGDRDSVVNKDLPYETEIIYDDSIDAGVQKIEKEGKVGKETVTTKITVKDGDITLTPDSEVLIEKEDRVVRIGTKPVEKTVEIPFNTEYVYDNTIDAGTIVEDKDHPGRAGSLTVKTYFDKEQGKFVSVEDEASKVAPVNKIVRVGTKPNDKMCPAPEDPSTPSNPSNPNPVDPVDPSNPSNPGNNPNQPGEETPSNPGTETPSEPGQDDPDKPGEETPSNPGTETPSEPGQDDPDKLGEETPSDPGENTPGDPGKEVSNEASKDNVSNKDEASEVVKGKKIESNKNDYSKAPKTFDAGIGGYVGATSLAGMMLAYLQKKKKEDQED